MTQGMALSKKSASSNAPAGQIQRGRFGFVLWDPAGGAAAGAASTGATLEIAAPSCSVDLTWSASGTEGGPSRWKTRVRRIIASIATSLIGGVDPRLAGGSPYANGQ